MRLLLTRRRNLILLAVLAVVPIFIGVAVKISNPHGGDGPQFIGRITGNGLFLVFTAITVSIPFFLPLVIGVVAGDSIAGEAGLGTLRYLLTVPVTRGRLLAVKTLGVATFTALAVVVVAVVGLLTGAALFGLHSLVLLSGDTVSIGDGLLRTLGVVGYVTIALFGLAAGGLFISTLTENAIAAMAARSASPSSRPCSTRCRNCRRSTRTADRSLARLRRTAAHVDQRCRPRPVDRAAPRLRRDLPEPGLVADHDEGHHQLNRWQRSASSITGKAEYSYASSGRRRSSESRHDHCEP